LPSGNWVYSNAGDVDTGTQNIAVANSMLVLATFVADNRNVAQDGTFTQLYDNDDASGADAGFSLNYRIETTTGTKGSFLNMDLSGTGSYPNHGVLFAVRPTPGGGAGLTINKPAGTTTGDVMVASIAVTPSTIGIIPPSDWTIVQDTLQTQDASSHLTTYYKIATGSEPASYAWNFSTSHAGAVGGIATFSGVDTTNPIVSSASLVENGNTAVDHTAPSITASSDDMLVTVHEYQSSGTWTPPTGMTEAVDKYSGAATGATGVSLEMNYLLLNAAGPTGDKIATASGNGDEGASHSLALRSAIVCFTDNFNGSLASNWVMASESGTFGNPRIVNQRLRLTDASTGASTMAALQQLFPAAGNKIIVEFDHFAYNGSGADGMCVVLSDASVAPLPGAFGGSLGYAPKQASAGGDTTHAGFAGGWLGVALDEYGNFSNPTEGRTGGPGFRVDSAAIRGSGSLYTGYPYLAGTATLAPGIDNAGSTTPAPGYRYRITIDHTNGVNAYTSVERDTGTGYVTLIPSFDAKAAAGQAAVPVNWYLSFTGSTGGATNIHDLDNLRVCSTQPQPLPTLDHVRILHDGQALTCAAENINLKACADATCSTLYLGPVTVNLTNIAGATWSSDPITFSGGQTTVTLNKATAGTVTLGGVVTSPAATNTTAVCYNGAAQSCSLTYTLSAACFDAVETGRSAATPIYTKLAGTAFSLDVLALAAGFTGPVSVALVDPTAPSGNCSDFNAGLTAEGAYNFVIGDNGRHTFNFNYPNAAKNVKVRIRNTSTNQSTCSSDNFAIRPRQLTLSTTTPLNPASNKLKAGADFNLTAASGVPAGYTGIPTTDPSKITDHNNAAIGTGILTGAFTAATGVNSVGTFQYLDVGTITLNANAVLDGTFTAVDQVTGLVGGVDHGTNGDCIANSASNTATVGFYGCNIGGTALGPLGRFYPDHYEVTANLAAACNGFTYMNQSALGVSLSIQAMASTGATPLSRFTSGYGYPATFSVIGDNNGTTIDPLNNRLTPDLPAFQWSNGAYTGSGAYSFDRAATPDGPFDNFKLKVTVTDADGAQITKLNGATITGASSVSSPATKIRYGRLRLPNAFGPETAPLIMALRAEYYNGTGFVTNALDNCTSLPLATRIFLNNPATAGGVEQPGTATMIVGGGTTKADTALFHSPFAQGDAGLSFSSPGSGNVGYVDIRVDVSAYPWLQIDWDNNGSLDPNLNARANFGIYRGNDRIINWREIIR
jgi:MSHA biogenesis protein MshQ